ncbi:MULTISPECIES: PhzF family phenazine biosynthesis protein [Sphingomonas]|uniref:PhzF family phenazine biosynthesis protein n=1 Tax=Sphingomonas leidyi TaxID=68569 RepID=A0A7X5V096_9SPHN|nr:MULTISPECIES: PhzF family phenazine biosynthesis protein [unclassified Sphingomonas]MBN8810300.1 PhzF family phenazine biosynthesis protein [Sphingomonas sp.]NIJ65529.1 PhzF family phenazine biosynthesis protein [Sphingomonas leidyi]OJY50850.1 MAG: PhzF family phenazine biosynthesis protein [Sphingomonas sp. 67-41]
MNLPFAQIDAFADRPFTGNPAAVMPLREWLADAVLQQIAEENNLSETAFLLPDASGAADFELRWFTPAVEVALCGHATLASGHFVLSAEPARDRVTFRTRRAGILEVRRDEAAGGSGYAMALPAYPPEPAEVPGLLAALGVGLAETLRHPNGYDLTVLESAEAVLALRPDFPALAAIGDTLNIVTAPGTDTDVISRVFAPAAGIDEDPVTGSAHSVLAPYWAKRLGRDTFSAFQASKRGGHLACGLAGDRVILGGKCATVIMGEFAL